MKTPVYTNRFKREYKLMLRRGRQRARFAAVAAKLLHGLPLEPRNEDHPLKGNYVGRRAAPRPAWPPVLLSSRINIDRDTPLLLPPDLRDWVPANPLAHFVLDAIEALDLRHVKGNTRGTGGAHSAGQQNAGLTATARCWLSR